MSDPIQALRDWEAGTEKDDLVAVVLDRAYHLSYPGQTKYGMTFEAGEHQLPRVFVQRLVDAGYVPAPALGPAKPAKLAKASAE